jgi:hypothetical protein
MAYTTNFSDAARRHLEAADCLHDGDPPCRRRDIAGYLYGLAAECALKELMRRSIIGVEPERAHFPELKSVVRDRARGRYASVLRRFSDTAFMNEWDIKMRYASKKEIPEALVVRWRGHAKAALSAMDDC